MKTAIFIQWREEALQQGMLAERRTTIESLLKARFGAVDSRLRSIIEPLLQMPPEEFSFLLLQLSKEELLARFGNHI